MNALYTTALYNGDDTEPGYTADLTAYIVGMARLRQLRVKNCRLLNYWKVRQILMHILKKKKQIDRGQKKRRGRPRRLRVDWSSRKGHLSALVDGRVNLTYLHPLQGFMATDEKSHSDFTKKTFSQGSKSEIV